MMNGFPASVPDRAKEGGKPRVAFRPRREAGSFPRFLLRAIAFAPMTMIPTSTDGWAA